MYPNRLMAYSVDLPEVFRRAEGPMAEVLRGKSPEEMPFYQPTRFQLVIAREQRSESDLSFQQN